MAAKIVWYSFYLLRPMLSAYHAVVRISGFINEPNVVCFFLYRLAGRPAVTYYQEKIFGRVKSF